MNGQTTTAKTYGDLLLTALFLVFASGTASAQVPVDEDGNTLPAYYEDEFESPASTAPAVESNTVFSADELETLVGPIALYPDDLLAIVLPASTYPLEIVQAARFLERLENDSSLQPDDEWDDSVVALLNYPDVVRMMDQDIDWTWKLGEAVISQQAEVIAAVEAFRDRAYAAGNLRSDEKQVVTYTDGTIEIEPASEEIIYVPYYEPEQVVVYQPRPVYHYYPNPYPVYYYPYPVGYGFHSGYFWGVTTAFSIGWRNHYLHVYHPTYWGHPYYGRTYYDYYYRRPSISIYNNWYVNNSYRSSRYRYRDGDYWRPRIRAGSRQDEPRVRNYHYPPGGDQRRRQDVTSRNSLANRDNGRLDLNLRQRSDADRARVASNNRGRTSVSRENNRRATAPNSRNVPGATTNRQPTRSPDTNRERSFRAGGDDRSRATNDNSRSTQNTGRENRSRPEIQFRDRSGATSRTSRPTPSSGASGNVRRSTEDTGRSSNAVLRQTNRSNASSERNRTPAAQQRTVSPRTTVPRSTAPRQAAPRVTAPRQSAPTFSAPRQSAPRQSAPRQSAPRVSAPRQSAPRVPAPRQQAAPRQSAPRQSAPRQSAAPKASAPRASSSSRRTSSGNRGSSRPRNGSN